MGWKAEGGFSALETLVILTILFILLGLAYTIGTQGGKLYRAGEAEGELQQNIRIGFERLTRELRAARTVQTATATEITFTNSAAQSIRYWVEGGELKRSVDGGAGVAVAGYVDGLTLTYSADGRLVTVVLAGQPLEGRVFSLRGAVYIRNSSS